MQWLLTRPVIHPATFFVLHETRSRGATIYSGTARFNFSYRK